MPVCILGYTHKVALTFGLTAENLIQSASQVVSALMQLYVIILFSLIKGKS